MNEAQIKARMKSLGEEAQRVVDGTKSNAEKRVELDRIDAEIQSLSDQGAALAQAKQFMGGGSQLGSGAAFGLSVSAKAFGGPSITPDEQQSRALFAAAKSHQSLSVEIETKSAMDLSGSIPADLAPGILAFRTEPTRIASLFPRVTMPGPSIEYIRHTGNSGSAGMVAPGGQKPEITLATDVVTATARKIAAHIGVTTETLLDFQSSSGYITAALQHSLTSAENVGLLNGDGVAPNLTGLLTTPGLLTRAQAASDETVLDVIEKSLNDLRTGASFTEATGIVMHPDAFSAARLLKNTLGNYVLGEPTDAGPATLWGKPVVCTTDIDPKTVVVGNFADGGAVLMRQGVTVQTQSAGADFTTNIVRYLAEERIALAIYRPSMFVNVTLL